MTEQQAQILAALSEGRVLVSRLQRGKQSANVVGTTLHVRMPTLDILLREGWIAPDRQYRGMGIGYGVTQNGEEALKSYESENGAER